MSLFCLRHSYCNYQSYLLYSLSIRSYAQQTSPELPYGAKPGRLGARTPNPDLLGPRPGTFSGKGPRSKNRMGQTLRFVRSPDGPNRYHGFLGKGKPLIKPARRWRGGRYNYFDWPTLVKCLYNCSSTLERDRMPSPHELRHFYKGAEKGIRHHGGFDVVAQLLNLAPYRPYLIKTRDYPVWIEDQQIESKMNEDLLNDRKQVALERQKQNAKVIAANIAQQKQEHETEQEESDEYDQYEYESDEYSDLEEEQADEVQQEQEQEQEEREGVSTIRSKAPSAIHRSAIPDYLNLRKKSKNIQGRLLSRADKKRIIHKIYIKLNKKFYESDKQLREDVQAEWARYKHQLRDGIIREEVEVGLNDEMGYTTRTRNYDGSPMDRADIRLERRPFQESKRLNYDRKLFTAGTNKHILLEDITHIDDEEKAYLKGEKEKGVRGKIRKVGSKMNPKNLKNLNLKNAFKRKPKK